MRTRTTTFGFSRLLLPFLIGVALLSALRAQEQTAQFTHLSTTHALFHNL